MTLMSVSLLADGGDDDEDEDSQTAGAHAQSGSHARADVSGVPPHDRLGARELERCPPARGMEMDVKHSYRPDCTCVRCTRERTRRQGQRQDRTTAEVMLDWTTSRNSRRARVAREYWDNFQSGRPMGSDDY